MHKRACRYSILPILLLPALHTPFASANDASTQCVDPDGDGWGWDGTQSCLVATPTYDGCVDTDGDDWGWDGTKTCLVGTPVVRQCIDTDGDGWGWDGTKTCLVDTPSSGECIDTDGDGWGWNGTGSCRIDAAPDMNACIDTDGDGWGWDGSQSCRVGSQSYTEQDKQNFQQGLIGYRVSDCFADGPDSFRIVDAYTGHYNMEDYHYFRDTTTCDGLPIGLSFPLQVYSYEIGQRVTVDDGRYAWEIDWTSVQRGGDEYGFLGEDYGTEPGEVSYGIAATESGGILYGFGDQIGTPPRETMLDTESFYNEIAPYGDNTLSVDALVASTWYSNCVFREAGSSANDTRVFTEHSEVFTRTVYKSEDCSGEVDFVYELRSSVEFEDSLSMTRFGGYLLNYREEINEALFTQGEPPASVIENVNNLQGRVKYQAFGLVGDTLISGDCLIRENCETSPETQSDILDLGFLYRWTRP